MTPSRRYDPPLPTYPWPTIVSPFADRHFHEEIIWYDTDYGFMSTMTRDKYKQHGLAQVTAFLTPTNTQLDRLLPITRYLIFHTVFDDYYELCPTADLIPIVDRMTNVILGESPRPDDNGLFHQAAKATSEFKALGMPDHWIERYANSMNQYMIHGVIAENSHKESGDGPPSPGYALFCHEYSVGMRPLHDMIEVATGSIMPPSVYAHPVIQRARALCDRIHVILNDLASLDRELARNEVEGFNYIIALEREKNLSLEEARIEALCLHDAAVTELDSLHSSVPFFHDLASHLDLVDNYIHHQKLMITGIADWYERGNSVRYGTTGGYPEPEYGQAQ